MLKKTSTVFANIEIQLWGLLNTGIPILEMQSMKYG